MITAFRVARGGAPEPKAFEELLAANRVDGAVPAAAGSWLEREQRQARSRVHAVGELGGPYGYEQLDCPVERTH
jgi:hypothetical protein